MLSHFVGNGGIKRWGYGRELHRLGIHELVNHKPIRVSDVDAPC